MNEIVIYDLIGENWYGDGITGKLIKKQLENMNGDLTIRINSQGGDVFEAAAIYNLLKEYEGKIIVKIDGLAASAASVVAMAGDEIIMPENSMLMIHNPWTFEQGEAKDFVKTAERLEKVKETIVNVYANKTGTSKQEVSELMDAETWLTSEESVSFGFATHELGDSETEKNEEDKKFFNLKMYKNCPQEVIERFDKKILENEIVDESKTDEDPQETINNTLDIKRKRLKLLNLN